MIPGKQYRPEDFLHVAWARKWQILVPFVIIAAATIVGVRFLPNRYLSETFILVVPQRVPETYVRSTVTTRIEDRVQTITQQILSRTRLERIVQDFNLYPEKRRVLPTEDIVDQMRNDIDVQTVKGDAFRLRYTSDNPLTAMRVVERLGSLFIEENLRDREILAEGTNQFLESELESARLRLVERERQLAEYQRKHDGELPAQLPANQQALHNAEMQVQAVVDSVNRDRDRRLMLERQLADLSGESQPVSTTAAPAPGVGAADPETGAPAGATAQQRLEAAQAALAQMQTRLKPLHPDIIHMKRLITDLEAKAAAEEAARRGRPVDVAPGAAAQAARANRIAETKAELENLTRQIAAKDAQEKQLRDQMAAYQKRIEAVPTRESEMAELTRDYETLQQTYRTLLVKKEDSQVAANLERRQIGEQFRILDPARLPEKPFSPDRLRLNLLGAVVGLSVGIGLAALFEYLDTTLKTEADVLVALSTPVLALIPYLTNGDDRRRQRRRRVAWWSVTATSAIVLAAVAVIAWKLRY